MSGADTSHSEYVGGLFRSHYPWLCARLRRHLDSSANAEDIAADTFVQLLSNPGLIPIHQPRALLTTIAQRLMYQLWRRRDLEHSHLAALQQDEEFQGASPQALAQVLETLHGIDRQLKRLPVKVRATFLLARVNGLTYPEVAEELGISQRSVSDYMVRSSAVCAPWNAANHPGANPPLLRQPPIQRSA
ncbi:sigma-70 family RNA polymerase sigma factor [Pseudomonas sp. H11T01]|uniref:sigma-70 family RNA polymerase sigma factor n=1 Tax=Pseudomonas sp. H11T01 TaxID=3402749 RepID=UPI003AD534EB